MAYTRAYLDRLSKEELVQLMLDRQQSRMTEPMDEERLMQAYTDDIIHLSPDAIMLINPETLFLESCNQPALDLLGLEDYEGLSRYLDHILQDRPLFYEILRELGTTLDEQPDISMEVEFKTSQGALRWGQMVCRKIKVLGQAFLLIRVVDISSIKQAQLQLLDSESQLKVAQEIASMGSYIYKVQPGEVQYSDALYKLFDVEEKKEDHPTTDFFQQYLHPEDVAYVEKIMSDVFSEKKGCSYQHRIITAKGIEKVLYCNIMLELDSQGEVSKVLGTLQDVTERVQTEQKLKESEERYRLTVENTTDGVWYLNLDTYESYLSPKYRQMLSYENRENHNESLKSWFEGIHPEDKQEAYLSYSACVKGDIDQFVAEFRYLNGVGQYVWIESRGSLIRDRRNRPAYMLGAITNIQSRKEAEERLKEKEKILNFAQNVAKVGSWLWDSTTDTLEFSDEMYCIMEIDPDVENRNIGKRMISLIHEEDWPKVYQFFDAIRETTEEDQIQTMELRMTTPAGSKKSIRTIGKVYARDKQGQVTKVLCTTQDITDDKNREQELIAAKEQAEVSRQAKDRFLQIVSHEIRNPLNAIVGITKLLQQSDLGSRENEQIRTLSFSAGHLLSIINDILDTAKLQYGKLSLDVLPFDIREQLRQTEELFRQQAADKEADLRFTIDKSIPDTVNGDPTRFNQIIFNLLSNAVKYTYRGIISLEASMQQQEGEHCTIRFVIADSGVGISAENLEKIFDPFEQDDLLINQQKGGTGLGLYIVRQLVGLMDGNIRVESTFGKGTRFIVTIPFAISGTAAATEKSRHLQAKFALKGKRILYVEDAVYNQLLLKGYAQVWDLSLDLAGSISEGVDMARQHQYDLILTDFRLPDGTGLDVAEKIKQLGDHYTAVPIIAISAYQLEERQGDYPFDDYLQKPIDFDKFFYLLRKYLKKNDEEVELTAETAAGVQGALGYLQEHQPGHYQQIVRNLEPELKELREQLLTSIEEQNYRLFLLTVHKLSSALKMIQEEGFLEYLQSLEDLPENPDLKKELLDNISQSFDKVLQKWKTESILGD
jgi:PAS domain S-box-containing protein